jgi:hypothetical protein
MARFKPAGSRKAQATGSKRGVVPCAIIILLGFAVMIWLLYEMMKSGK